MDSMSPSSESAAMAGQIRLMFDWLHKGPTAFTNGLDPQHEKDIS
jgi:hypothetical protein